MRLLMVARRFPPDVRSGAETVFEALWRRARARHEVRLLAGFRRDRMLLPEDAVPVDLRQRSRARAWLAVWNTARTQIRTFRPDVVLSNAIEVPVLDRPTACIVHDLNFGGREHGAGAVGRRLFYRWRARRLVRIVTVSEAMRRLLVVAGMPADRIVAIANGVDLERFHPAPGPGRPDGRLALCYPARILPGKGQHVAVDAVARLPRSVRDRLVLAIVGTVEDPTYLRRLRRQARGLPVEFHLDVPDVVVWYQKADVVVFPTLMHEGFGFTAAEALACGRPVIASDQEAIREAAGGLAIPVPQGDAAALAVAIEALALDADRRERLGREGRAWVDGHASWDAAWSAYEALLARVAEEDGR